MSPNNIWHVSSLPLSWAMPGVGHFFINKKKCGIGWLGLYVITTLIVLWGLLSDTVNPVIITLALILACVEGFFSIGCCVDLYFRIKKQKFGRRIARRGVAILLTMLIPGLGHLYLKRWSRGFVLIVAWGVVLCCVETVQGMIATGLYALLIGISVFNLSKSSYAATFLIVGVWVMKRIAATILALSYAVTPTDGPCMTPTIYSGEFILERRNAYLDSEPQIGDIVSFYIPDGYRPEASRVWSKRVVAKGGDTIRLKRDGFYYNGERINTEYSRCYLASLERAEEQGAVIDFTRSIYPYDILSQDYTVPEGHYFLMGDNIFYSGDSKIFGPIKKDRIIRKSIKIVWPYNRIRLLTDSSGED